MFSFTGSPESIFLFMPLNPATTIFENAKYRSVCDVHQLASAVARLVMLRPPSIRRPYSFYRFQRIPFFSSSLCAQLRILHLLGVTVDSRDNTFVTMDTELIASDNSI
jgi:hypothetical protein